MHDRSVGDSYGNGVSCQLLFNDWFVNGAKMHCDASVSQSELMTDYWKEDLQDVSTICCLTYDYFVVTRRLPSMSRVGLANGTCIG